MLEGSQVGPYDRRTLVGMRIKKALTSEHVLIDSAGMQLTLADLIGRRPGANDFSPNRTSGFSIVQATYPASLLQVQGKGLEIPKFRGEVEARVQGAVLRIAGRFRKGFGWTLGRVKLPLKDIVHARVRGSQVDLWLRRGEGEGQALQRVELELFTRDAAGELVEWLPAATPWPEPVVNVPVGLPAAQPAGANMLWVSALGMAVVVGVVLTVLVVLRVY